MKTKLFVTLVLVLLNIITNAQINGSLFKWQGNINSSWSNSLNWQVWDSGSSTWVINSLGTFPNSTTHTVTVDFTSATTKTLNLDVSSGNADVGQLFLINNLATQANFNFSPNVNLSVYNTYSVSGTNTIVVACNTSNTPSGISNFAGGISGGGFIFFKPTTSYTLAPVFANSTYNRVGIVINGLGTTIFNENNLSFQGFIHISGSFYLNGLTLNCVSTFQMAPTSYTGDSGMLDLLGSTINTQSLRLCSTPIYGFAAQTTTVNLNGLNTTHGFCTIQYDGNALATVTSTLNRINITGGKTVQYVSPFTTINSGKNILINNLSTTEELVFSSNQSTEYRIKNWFLNKPLNIVNTNPLNIFKEISSIITATSTCNNQYHFISKINQTKLETTVPITVDNMSFLNAEVSVGSITSNNGVDMGYNTGIIFNSPLTTFGANTYTWNGSVSDKWDNAINWTPNCVPDILDNVVIPSGTTNPLNLVNISGICYNFNTVGSPTISVSSQNNLIIGGNFIRTAGTLIRINFPQISDVSITLLGILPNTSYSITSNGSSLPQGNVVINTNTLNTVYNLTDNFVVNYPSVTQGGGLSLVSGKLQTNGFELGTRGFYIPFTSIAAHSQSVNISNSIVRISNSFNGNPLLVVCSKVKEFNTSNSSIYFELSTFNAPSTNIITIANLPANNHLATPSFSFDRVILPESQTIETEIVFSGSSAATSNTTSASGFKINSLKAMGNTVLNGSNFIRNILNIDSLYVRGGFSLTGQASNSITINKYINSSANCQTGAFTIMSSSVGVAPNNQFYINTTASFSAIPIDYWNIDAVRVNQGAGGVPSLTVTNANITSNSGVSPSNGWITSTQVPKTFYWVGEGATSNWTDLDNWSYNIPTNGDEPTAGCLPSLVDDVIFTNLSFYGNTNSTTNTSSLVTVDNTVYYKDMRWLGPFNTTITGTTPLYPTINSSLTTAEMNVGGSIRMHKTMKWDFGNTLNNNNNVRFLSALQDTIEMQNNSFGGDIYFEGSGKYVVIDSLVLSSVTTTTLNSTTLTGSIVHRSGELDLLGNKLFACGYQSNDNSSLKRKLNISNSEINIIALGLTSAGISFGNSVADTYTLDATNSIINIKPFNNVNVNSTNILLRLVTSTLTTEPRLNFNKMNISSFSPSNNNYRIEVIGKGVDIDSLIFDVLITRFLNTVLTQTNTINYLKYRVGSTNDLSSGATTLLGELDAKSVCDPINIQSTTTGVFANLCPSTTVPLQASQTSIKYINSACGSYVSPTYNTTNGNLASFVPTGSENTYGWGLSTTAAPLGFLSVKSSSVNCSQLPFTINADEFNASATTHTLVWRNAIGTYTGTPLNGLDLTTFTTNTTGTHTLTVTYKTGCVVIDTYTLNINNDVNVTPNITDVNCNSETNGSFTISATTGTVTTDSYNYLVSPGSYTTSSVSGLAPNIYSYTVTNLKNESVCRASSSFTISEPTVLAVSSAITASINCFGASTGSLTSTPTGGNGGYLYLWTNGTNTYTTQNANAVVAGTYSLVVTDSKNCVATSSIVLQQPSSPVIISSTINNSVICSGSSTTITPSGANTYTLTSSAGTLTSHPFIVSPIANTTYTLVGTNGLNCLSANTLTTLITVNATPTITTSGATSATLCSGQSYTITLSGSGTGSYTLTPGNLISTTNFVVTPSVTTTYSIIGANSNGCISTTSSDLNVSLTVNATPTITTTGAASGTLCSQQSFTVSPIGSGTGSYTLIPGGITTTTNFVITPSVTTTYSIIGLNSNGCVSSTSTDLNVSLIVNATPTITTTGATTATLCSGQNFTITPSGSGTSSYTLSPGGLTTTTNFIVTPSATTTYSIIGLNSNGCISTTNSDLNVSLTVNATPTVAANFSSNALCSSQNVTITMLGASANYTIEPGTQIVTPATGSLVISPTAGTTIYTIKASNTNGCVTALSTQIYTTSVSVVTNPTITVSAITNSICAGGTASITPFGATTFTIINSADATTYTLSSGQTFTSSPASPTTYTINGTATGGCLSISSTQFVATIGINANPTVAVSATSNTVCSGISSTLTAIGATSYTWVSGPTTPGYIVTPNSTSVYTVMGTNALGCTNNFSPTTSTVNVLSSPTLALATSISSNTLCSGSSATITLGGASAGSTYTLFPDGVIGTTSIVVTPLASLVYTVISTDNLNGCVSTTAEQVYTTTLSVLASPTIALVSVTPSATLCAGESVTIVPTGAVAGSYTLVNAPTTIEPFVVSPTATTIYTINGSSLDGCISTVSSELQTTVNVSPTPTITLLSALSKTICSGSTTTLSISGATSYSWTGGPNNSDYIVTPSATSVYTLVGENVFGCTNNNAPATLTVVVNNTPTVVISNTTQASCVLSNGSVTLTTIGGTAPYTYSWVPTSAASYTTLASTNGTLSVGTTSIYVIDDNGCNTNTAVNITNPNAPVLTSTVTNIVCYGTNTGSIATDVVASSACTYTWSNNTYSADLSGVGAGIYTVSIQDASFCLSTQTIAITQPSVSFDLQITNVVNVCQNQSNGSATVTVSGGTPTYNYTWQPTNTNSNVLTNASLGSYTVYVTDANACITSTVVNFALNLNPVSITLNSITEATCKQSNGLILIDVTGGTQQYNYQWLPTSVTSQNLENALAGTYTVVVTDNEGCADSLAITIDCKVPLFIPEFLSPNSNGQNEVFEIKGIENYPNNTISIFNRWGNLVYTKKNYDNSFDGRANVSSSLSKGLLSSGTYFVVIDFGDNGSTQNYNGYLELKY